MEHKRTAEQEGGRLPGGIAESALESAGSVVFVTDSRGTITWVNAAFTRVTGWLREEAWGENPRILQSGLQDHHYYRSFWGAISGGHCFSSRVVNRKRDGGLYVVAQTVTPLPRGSRRPTHFVAFQEDVSREMEQARELRNLAYGDPLTGLGNRRALLERLELCRKRGEDVALLLMDMDNFKGINDSFGHDVGDEALRQVAEAIRETGVAAFRLGGDEFVALVARGDDSCIENAEGLARRIRKNVSTRRVGPEGRALSVSIGVACHGGQAPDSSWLLRRADMALAAAKGAGGGVRSSGPVALPHGEETRRLAG